MNDLWPTMVEYLKAEIGWSVVTLPLVLLIVFIGIVIFEIKEKNERKKTPNTRV